MMVRTLASSIVIAIGIAVALSFLPSVDLMSNNEVSVFRGEDALTLSKDNLVEFLSVYKTSYTYRHVEWDEQKRLLQVDFTANEQHDKTEIAAEWWRFTQDIFHFTGNVETLVCRLYNENDDSHLAVLKVNRDELERLSTAKDVNEDRATMLEQHFYFQIQ